MATNKHLDKNQDILLTLTRAGLWEKGVQLLPYGEIDYSTIYDMAERQGVVGLVAAGLEHVTDTKIPQVAALTFAGVTIQMEQRNKAMNQFIAELVEKMRAADIYTLLVKGQGVAQCYERPLWRPSGDIDFLLSEEDYKKAVELFKTLYSNNKNGGQYSKEYAFYTDQWMIELHGTLRTCLSATIDKEVDAVMKNVFYRGNVRSWLNGGTQVFLPAPTEDVFLVFTHFIKHFYKEGMTLRQVCDWCRLLYTYRESLDYGKLESWIRKSGLMGEWKAFGAMAIEYLGFPRDSMPLLNDNDDLSDSLKHKAERLMAFILGGYFGSKVKDTWQIAKTFSWKVLRYSPSIFLNLNWLKVKEWLFSR